MLQRDTATTAHIMIHETGRADAAFAVKRDP